MTFKKDEMLILPAVDIKNGKCVQLVQGKPGSEMVAALRLLSEVKR